MITLKIIAKYIHNCSDKNFQITKIYFKVVATGNTVYYLRDDKVIWQCEFDNYLFGLSKLDVNDDGTDEVVVVSSTTGQVCMYVCKCGPAGVRARN